MSDFEGAIRESFQRQRLMATYGAVLSRVAEGEVDVELAFRDDLGQQHGFLHAGVVTAIADTAAGYAALTRMPPGSEVMSVEFKVNLLSPAAGERFVAKGRVLRAGKTLSVCAADVYSGEKLVATLLGTFIRR